MFVCCVLSGRGLCDELITRPEESYRLWYVVVCDLEKLIKNWRGHGPPGGCSAIGGEKNCTTFVTAQSQYAVAYHQCAVCCH